MAMGAVPRYRRVVLKLSGETLGRPGEIFDAGALAFLAENVREVAEAGVEIGIVGGGGNIVRGVNAGTMGIERTAADQMGMLATVINGMALRGALEQAGLRARLFSCVPVGAVAELYSPRAARQALEDGEVGIFSGGTGNPFVSTDTAALLRACDICADAVLKATKVDGIYTADPKKDPNAVKFEELTYVKALELGLKIMDFSAFGLASENGIPVLVFDFWAEHALRRAAMGEKIGTLLHA
ncbi:MAG TPA: UMP kinase [bacterium]|nr:UMP kinase [bacterium]HPQ66175.1 UMP kinase [bacterium]